MNDRSSRLTVAHSMNKPLNCYAYACKFNDQIPYSTHIIIIEPYSPMVSLVLCYSSQVTLQCYNHKLYVLVLNYAIYKMEA